MTLQRVQIAWKYEHDFFDPMRQTDECSDGGGVSGITWQKHITFSVDNETNETLVYELEIK